jgi:hypothetical protein
VISIEHENHELAEFRKIQDVAVSTSVILKVWKKLNIL